MAGAKTWTRRAAITAAFGGAGYLVANADKLTLSPDFARVFQTVEDWTQMNQRALLFPERLAREYSPADISPVFKPNGTTDPNTREYSAHVRQNFANWQLVIDGLVAKPLSLSLTQIMRLPRRTQITKHDCVEGWTAIGMWTGVPLGLLLKSAGLKPSARYAVLHCADNLTGEPSKGGEQSPGQYYESIDLRDAFHQQTLMAYALNGKPLDVALIFTAAPPAFADMTPALVSQLRQGGFVIVMRHASSPSTLPSAQDADPDNKNLECQLDAQGKQSAAAMGKAIKSLHIPIGRIFSSPTFRAMETVRLAQFEQPTPEAALGDQGQSMAAMNGPGPAAWLKAAVTEAPQPNSNTIIVTHLPNIAAAFPEAAQDLKDGESIIFRPPGGIVAKVAIGDWPLAADGK
jgi:DMSO/TMAO reductase YedYZ molybdopterin-dependent catalytic subunit/phosphohistidine phosphatase SixA